MNSYTMKRFLLLGIISSLFFTTINAQPPESAEAVLKNAYTLAAKENKNVFIIFHASWCGWCHKMDSSMNDTICKKFFDDNYIIRHLVVHESKNKKNLENPGARDLLAIHNGGDQGIPFWLIIDKNGKLLADSQMRTEGEGLDKKGRNSGCPAAHEEVDYFLTVLKKTSRITEPGLASIKKRFLENAN
jgi:thiol-disulfide isomerase/thioredoxin